MLDFFERAYFAELERKSKLQSALAFPFSVAVVGVTLLGFASQKWPLSGCANFLLIFPVVGSLICLAVLVMNFWKFSIGREYQYIWTPGQALEHRETLRQFKAQFPGTPDADETFRSDLERDIAFCASHNAKMNDERSENLYHANASALILTLISLLTAIFVVAVNFAKAHYG